MRPALGRGLPWRAVLAVVGCLVATALAGALFGAVGFSPVVASLASVAARQPALAAASMGGLYVALAALAVPGHAALSVVAGALFGAPAGAGLAVCGTTAGACLLFLAARRRAGRWLAGGRLARALDDRPTSMATLVGMRLMPVLPGALATLLASASGMRLGGFAAATALGIAPATLALAFAGEGLARLVPAEGLSACAGAPACWATVVGRALDLRVTIALIAIGALALAPVVVRTFGGRRS